MAILFTSHDNGDTILFSGQSSLSSVDSGVAGPSPNYSINREDIKTSEGTYINSKYTINITGTAVLASYPADMSERQNLSMAQEEAFIVLNKLSVMYGNGRLDISPYGGQGNIISFYDAKITSLSTVEQGDENLGTQNIQFNVAFEAYREISDSNSEGDPDTTPADPSEYLSSVEETWDLSPSSGQYTYKDRDLKKSKDTDYKTYSLTHTMSAVGVKRFSSNKIDETQGHAWKQAYNWVLDRKASTEESSTEELSHEFPNITKDLVGNKTDPAAEVSGGDLSINNFNRSNDTDIFDLTDYRVYNKVRSITSNISEGLYSVTDTYLMVYSPKTGADYQKDILASYDIEVSIDEDSDGSSREATITGTITGFSSVDSETSHNYNAYDNAKSEFDKLLMIYKTDSAPSGDQSYLDTFLGKCLQEAFDNYTAIGNRGTLNKKPSSHTESHDKVNGSISFTTSFNDETSIDGIISRTEVVNYTNYQNLNPNDETNAEMKTHQPTVTYTINNSPTIYLTSSTDEKKASISIDIIYDLENRNAKPSPATGTVPITYDSDSGAPQITSDTESWNPKTGSYNRTLEYTYV